jgi:UDP-glucose 4-epimerase
VPNPERCIPEDQRRMKQCLVIGGAGFIGRALVRLLCQSGRRVTVLGRRSIPEIGLPDGCTYVSGDYGNRAMLRELMSPGCEVIDLAYSTVPKTSYGDPVFDLISNVPVGVGLLQEALAAGVARLLFVSSGGTVYGPAHDLPITEDHPTNPLSPYGITKLTIENYALMYHRTMDLPVVIARPANAYGEEQKANLGQGFIAAAINAILNDREVEVYGEKGTVRDYIHVSDIATGLMSLLDSGKNGQIYNIGTGIGTTNSEILTIINEIVGKSGKTIRVKNLPFRRFDVTANVLNSGKLTSVKGWFPEISIQEGIKSMCHSFDEQI